MRHTLIEQSPDVTGAKMKPEEAQAVEIVWAKRGCGGTMPADDALEILSEVRERTSRIEESFVRVGYRAFAEGRRTPRRHQLLALAVICVGIVISVVLLLTRFR